ncbi:MAG: peroxiredoxin [Candidatus Caldarchaeum sp.]|jgi:peroxiredoxin Q/BCP|uniref:thioredoxin-dependent peroxiredoxin n=1 Tax=Caldiarchaeum subterraneum TaxID=311458 RepID=A0A7C5Q4D8_CALS0
MKPEPGDKAPDFELPDHQGRKTSLKQLLQSGRALVLYFYPKDDTPGCTTEACGFRDSMEKLSKHGVNVVGVSVDSPESHQKFIAKYGLNFTLLTDADGKVARLYNSYSEEKGRCIRKTFIIDKDGVIRAAFHKVVADGHAEEVLQTIKKLGL